MSPPNASVLRLRAAFPRAEQRDATGDAVLELHRVVRLHTEARRCQGAYAIRNVLADGHARLDGTGVAHVRRIDLEAIDAEECADSL